MPIKDSNGNPFLLKGPNKLIKDNGKFWDLSSIKYVNFEDYGKPFKLTFTRNVIDDVKKDKQIIEKPKDLSEKIISKIIEQDDYLKEEKEELIESEYPISNNESNIELVTSSDNNYKSGSPVLYYSSRSSHEYREKIYAQIHHSSTYTCIFEFDISQWHEKIIQNPEENDLIHCEWDSTWWKIISIIKMGEVTFRIITEKHKK